MNLNLEKKLALVTASTAGIGYAIAEALSSEGANVIINGRTQEAVDRVIAELNPRVSGEVFGFSGDLSTAEDANNLVQKFPNVDILVNNLGIYEMMSFDDISDDDWRRFFEINVLSSVRLSRLYLPQMKEKNWGRIIFISSESAVQIPAEMIHYGMTKTAQLSIARGLAESVSGTGITVNSVLPGPTRSRGAVDIIERLANEQGKSSAEIEKDFMEHMRPTSLIKRFSEPSEIASMVTYIASPLASATTGAALRADGGVIKSIL